MTALLQQERRKRRQTDRESLELIRKRHLEVAALASDAVPPYVHSRGLALRAAVPGPWA